MKRILTGLLITAALTACSVDPQAAADRRQSLIQHIFPAPADQRGLHLVFPIESFGYYSSMQIIFFPNEVSEGAVSKRVARYCSQHTGKTQAFTKRPAEATMANLADGSQRPATSIWYTCRPPKS
ncbi:lipoprotein [Pseudophaeobacter sp.]|uniref:lipoprotein n=1 Tax=Pseudophaeobacter sp. TaxID=1971739 RepID=UPI0040588206